MKVFYNAHLYDCQETAFVEDQGKIIFMGNDQEALGYKGEKVNLNGQYVYPGFNDSHMHFVGYGQYLSNVLLENHTSSLQEVLTELKRQYQPGQKLFGRGWNHDYFTDVHRFPTKDDLDQISRDDPIAITRACGHVLVANSKAIELADLKEVEGGSYDVETGLFKENAVSLIYDAINKPTVEDIKNMILKAQKSLNAYGITSVQSDDFLSATSHYQDALTAFEELNKEKKLTVRVNEQAQLRNIEELKEFMDLGYRTGVGDEFFKIGPLKILSDGSLGARTAYLSQDYADQSGTRGMAIFKREELSQFIEYAHKNQMQIAIHAIGDGALDDVLYGYQNALTKYPRDNHRHGVVHCQITREDQYDWYKKLHLHAYIQSIFLDYDNHIVEQRVIPEIAKTSYPFATLSTLTTISNGSDCPVENPDVLKGIQLAVTRTSIDGTGPYLINEALSRKEAIDSYTKNGAFASFEENIKGQLQVGMYCDFVVLEEDILSVSVHHIKDIHIRATYMNGEKVFESED